VLRRWIKVVFGEQFAAGRSLLLAMTAAGHRQSSRYSGTSLEPAADQNVGSAPHFAAIERTLPGHVAEGHGLEQNSFGLCLMAQNDDDLLRLSEKIS